MPVYLCRWPNGDSSVVVARNKEDAIVKLDEFDNAEHADLFPLQEFMVDFRLSDDGNFEISNFGEETYSDIMKKAYPILDKFDFNETSDRDILTAVESERKRLWGRQKSSKSRKPS